MQELRTSEPLFHSSKMGEAQHAGGWPTSRGPGGRIREMLSSLLLGKNVEEG